MRLRRRIVRKVILFRALTAALDLCRAAQGHDPERRWGVLLFVLTATEDLWAAYRDHLDYRAGAASLEDTDAVGAQERLLLSVARALFAGAPGLVDLAACCATLDVRAFNVLVAACRLWRGDTGAARVLLDG